MNRTLSLLIFLVPMLFSIITLASNTLGKLVPEQSIESPYLQLDIDGVLEGSARYGGLQPDYLLDWDHLAFENLKGFTERLKPLDLPLWDKIEKLRKYMTQELLPWNDYKDPEYLKLIKSYKKAGKNIPLSRYVFCGAGVCREHAIIMHFALRELGIESRYVYAEVTYGHESRGDVVKEDHAFNVIRYRDQLWVVDSYGDLFHGFSLDELASFRGVHRFSSPAPGINLSTKNRRIVRFHLFKASKKMICEQVFL